jgi:hypothetical protein
MHQCDSADLVTKPILHCLVRGRLAHPDRRCRIIAPFRVTPRQIHDLPSDHCRNPQLISHFERETEIPMREVRPETLLPLTLGNPVAISEYGSNRQEDRHAGHRRSGPSLRSKSS